MAEKHAAASETVKCSICHDIMNRATPPELCIGAWNVCQDCWHKIQDYLTARGFAIVNAHAPVSEEVRKLAYKIRWAEENAEPVTFASLKDRWRNDELSEEKVPGTAFRDGMDCAVALESLEQRVRELRDIIFNHSKRQAYYEAHIVVKGLDALLGREAERKGK